MMHGRRAFLDAATVAGGLLAAASSVSALPISAASQVVVFAWIVFGREVDDAIRSEMNALAAATRREAGCLIYDVALDLEDPSRLRLLERWSSYAALEEHFRTPHMRQFRAGLRKYPSLTSGMEVFAVTGPLTFKAPPID